LAAETGSHMTAHTTIHLRKPHLFDTAPNKAFLRGFPASHFSDFGLCWRPRILMIIFGALSRMPSVLTM
jgi:hypothetical protein